MKVPSVTAALRTSFQSTSQREEAKINNAISNMLRKPRKFHIIQTKIHKINPCSKVKQKEKRANTSSWKEHWS